MERKNRGYGFFSIAFLMEILFSLLPSWSDSFWFSMFHAKFWRLDHQRMGGSACMLCVIKSEHALAFGRGWSCVLKKNHTDSGRQKDQPNFFVSILKGKTNEFSFFFNESFNWNPQKQKKKRICLVLILISHWLIYIHNDLQCRSMIFKLCLHFGAP